MALVDDLRAKEPDYIAQTGEPMTQSEGQDWLRARAQEAHSSVGATFFRCSLNTKFDPPLWLVEGWKVQPRDQGPMRWQLAASEAPTTENENAD